MESCSSIINDNKLQLINDDYNDQINNELKNNEKNELVLDSLLSDKENIKKALINSHSTSSLLSENESKEIEKAYQIADDIKYGKIRRIDPSRFLHSLPDGAYPQLPKLKKYTTIYTSNILFPLNNMNDNQYLNNNSVTDKEIEKKENNKLSVKDFSKLENNKNLNDNIDLSNNNEIEIDKTYKNLMPKFTDMVKVKKINFPMIMDVLNGKRTNLLYERHEIIIKKLIMIISESMARFINI